MPTITSLPADDPTNGWSRILPERTPTAPLATDIRADWLVIGGGYAGLAAAGRLAETRPHDHIVVLEAQKVDDGSSGRNSGFMVDLPTTAAKAHLENSLGAMRLYRTAMAHLEGLVGKHGIDCQWGRRGQYQAAVSGEGEKALEAFAGRVGELDEEFTVLGRKETQDALGTAYYRAAVYTPGTVLVHPAALVRGLAGALPGNVTLYENTPVTRMEYGPPVVAHTPRGTVTAPAVILAVNGFAPAFGFFRRQVFTLSVFASLTRQLTAAERAALGGRDDWGILPTNVRSGPSIRLTADNRIMYRQFVTYAPGSRTDAALNHVARRYQEPLFRARFPMLPEVGFEHTWAGTVCLSWNYAPGFGRVAPNVFSAVCQCGVGLTRGTISGLLAADMAAGRDNPLIADMEELGRPSVLPPRPFLDVGARTGLAWTTWRGRAEK